MILIKIRPIIGLQKRTIHPMSKDIFVPSKKRKSTHVDYRNVVQKKPIRMGTMPTIDAEYATRILKLYSTYLRVANGFVSQCIFQ